jgi:general secretion pathway protein M
MRLSPVLVDTWRDLDSRHRLWCGYTLIALLAIVMGWSALATRTTQLERKRAAREAVLNELLSLKVAYRTAKASSDMQIGRAAAVRPDDTPAKIVEEIGFKGKGIKISPLKGEERSGFIEDTADVRIEGLTANETVNLLYRLEKGSRPVMLKKTNLRVRFDDQSRLDLALVIALLKPAPGQTR